MRSKRGAKPDADQPAMDGEQKKMNADETSEFSKLMDEEYLRNAFENLLKKSPSTLASALGELNVNALAGHVTKGVAEEASCLPPQKNNPGQRVSKENEQAGSLKSFKGQDQKAKKKQKEGLNEPRAPGVQEARKACDLKDASSEAGSIDEKAGQPAKRSDMRRVLRLLVKNKLLPLGKPYKDLPAEVIGSVAGDFKKKYGDVWSDKELKDRIRKRVGQQRWRSGLNDERKQDYKDRAKQGKLKSAKQTGNKKKRPKKAAASAEEMPQNSQPKVKKLRVESEQKSKREGARINPAKNKDEAMHNNAAGSKCSFEDFCILEAARVRHELGEDVPLDKLRAELLQRFNQIQARAEVAGKTIQQHLPQEEEEESAGKTFSEDLYDFMGPQREARAKKVEAEALQANTTLDGHLTPSDDSRGVSKQLGSLEAKTIAQEDKLKGRKREASKDESDKATQKKNRPKPHKETKGKGAAKNSEPAPPPPRRETSRPTAGIPRRFEDTVYEDNTQKKENGAEKEAQSKKKKKKQPPQPHVDDEKNLVEPGQVLEVFVGEQVIGSGVAVFTQPDHVVLGRKLGGHRVGVALTTIDSDCRDVVIPAKYTTFEAMGPLTVGKLPVQGMVIDWPRSRVAPPAKRRKVGSDK